MPSNNLKRDVYVKVFKQELIRELQYLWDVANNRAAMRDTFIDQMMNALQHVASLAPFANIHLSYLLDAGQFAANQVRDKKMGFIADLVDEIELPRLEIVADIVAHEAMWRYEQFIVQRLSDDLADGVIPFAKAGVARVIEKLVRCHGKKNNKGNAALILNESNLLSGLIEGRSGALIQGLTNTTLTLKRQKKGYIRGLLIGNNATITAEDVYGRSGFRCLHITQNSLKDTLYTRKKPYHQDISAWAKVRELYQGKADIFYNFGYTYFRKKEPHDPKCGYATMPMDIIQKRYHYEEQNKKVLSKELSSELDHWTPGRIQIDEVTFAEYLKWNKQHPDKDIRDFVEEKFGVKTVQLIQYQGSLQGMSLKEKNLSYMDLSGCIISGDVTATNFSHSYLIATHFSKVTSARETNFYAANCAFLTAEDVDFTDADFTQTNFSYAVLNRATFARCKTLGTNWQKTEVKDTTGDQEILQEQSIKIVEMRLELQQHTETLNQQTQILKKLQCDLQNAKQANISNPPQLAEEVAYLIQQTESQQALEYYFQQELSDLKTALLKTTEKSEVDALKNEVKIIYDLLAKQQSAKKFVIDDDVLANLSASLARQWSLAFENYQQQQKRSLQHIQQLHDNFQQEVKTRLSQLESRVDNLEQWAGSVEAYLQELKRDKDTGIGLQNRISKLEALVYIFMKNPAPIKLESIRKGFDELQTALDKKENNVALFKSHQPQQNIARLVASMPKTTSSQLAEAKANNLLDQQAAEIFYSQGLSFEQAKDYKAARLTYEQATEKGSMRARTNLAYFYMTGVGETPIDIKLAYDYLLLSALDGHTRAMKNLAKMLAHGHGPIQADEKMSRHWDAEAAKSESQPSQPGVLRRA
jgi:uncharacterized protein YjbI with pentapeptide repeats